MLSGLAMGVPRGRLVWRRATRVALQPFLALIGLALPVLVGGAVVVETVFTWPGLGRVHKAALEAQDPPLALGGIILIALAVILAGIFADLLAIWADPRLRPGSSHRRAS
jgi:peptide/nickel transport system permease protein